jgi:hypothetical protein
MMARRFHASQNVGPDNRRFRRTTGSKDFDLDQNDSLEMDSARPVLGNSYVDQKVGQHPSMTVRIAVVLTNTAPNIRDGSIHNDQASSSIGENTSCARHQCHAEEGFISGFQREKILLCPFCSEKKAKGDRHLPIDALVAMVAAYEELWIPPVLYPVER